MTNIATVIKEAWTMDLGTLEALEQIKQLKAHYFRLVDNKRWKEWVSRTKGGVFEKTRPVQGKL